MTGFTNEHLSFSRTSRFERCPLSYRLHYIDKVESEPNTAMRFGKVIHAVLERLIREAVDDERTGPLSDDRALAIFREAWTAENLTGVDLFQEGIEILKGFVRDQGVLEHRDILAVEKEFRLPVGPFTLLGFIDRVDCVDRETIRIIDYKTNRQLYSRDDLDTNLQVSIYHAAARRMWPWAKDVKLTFWMLRHGVRQETTRTPGQIESALTYVETLGRQTESASEFPARINPDCVYCDHRLQCPAYADALTGKHGFVCPDMSDLEAVAREREEIASLSKVISARKEELEDVIKAHLTERDELILGGVRYTIFNAAKYDYPLDATIDALTRFTGRSRNDLIGRLAVIENKSLDKLLKELGKETDRSRVALLKAELEANAEKTHIPRFWAKPVAK